MRIVILIMLLIYAISANAKHIPHEEAYSVALEFFGQASSSKKAPGINQKLERVDLTDSPSDWQPYYVFNKGTDNGFVIISGEDRSTKILGYSDKGCFDLTKLPPQLKVLLNNFSKELDSIPDSTSPDASWTVKSTRSDENGVLLETANWGQGYPYNNQCPVIDGVQAPTGCVATAMAIVMKYHSWPNRGRSQHSYDWDDKHYFFDFNNETFDWAQMPLEYVENEFAIDQVKEVSKLMLAIGNSVDMMYSSDESGASADNIPYHLYRFFRYNIPAYMYKSGGCPDNKSYTDEEWLSIIKDQINAGNPLLYSYIDHMYVIDGYDNYGLLHVNWGWDGNANGYYAINQMGFNEAMISYIIPDYSEDDSFETVVLSDGSLSGGAQYYGCALNINTTDIIPNEEYEVAYTCLTQTRKNFGSFHVTLALTDIHGKIKEILAAPMVFDGFPSDIDGIVSGVNGSWGIKIEHEIDPSDLIMCVIKKEDEPEDNYRPIKTPYHIKPYLKVRDNSPIYNNITLDVGDGISVTKYYPQIGWANIGDEKAIEDSHTEICYLANSRLNLSAVANHGIPHIMIGDIGIGKFENYKYNRSVYSSILSYNPVDVSISIIPFEDMLDINVSLDTEGVLDKYINSTDYKNIKSLKITGRINIEDFKFINRCLENIQTLDLSDATIVPNIIDFKSIPDLNFLKSLVLPSNLEKIGDLAFFFPSYGCLEIMDIPSSVTSISGYAFAMPSLDTYIVHSAEPIKLVTPEKTFSNIHNGHVLYVPRGSKDKYSTTNGWKNFQTIIEYDNDWRDERKEQNISLSVDFQDNLIIANCHSNSDEYGMRGAADIFLVEGAEYVDVSSIKYGPSRDCTLTLKPKPNVYGEILLEARKEGDGHFVAAIPVQSRVKVNTLKEATQIFINSESGEQIINNLEVNIGDIVKLNVKVLPEDALFKTVNWSSSDNSVATVDNDGNITIINVGKATITASCGDVSADCQLKCYPLVGDANWNGDITITDAVDISNYVLEKKEIPSDWDKEEWTEFYVKGANANGSEDGSITFADASAAVKLALSQPVETSTPSRIHMSPDHPDNTGDELVVGDCMIGMTGVLAVPVTLSNSREYVALQADIIVPEGTVIESVNTGKRIIGEDMLFTRRISDNHIRIAIFNSGNIMLADNNEPIIEVAVNSLIPSDGDLRVSNILASDEYANEYVLSSRLKGTSDVDNLLSEDIRIVKDDYGVSIFNAMGRRIVVNTLDGHVVKNYEAASNQEIINLSQGIYVVKVGDKTRKIAL